MEAVKDIKTGNGVPIGTEGPKSIECPRDMKEIKDEKVVDINKITDEDLSNLKQIFTWALTVTTKDREILKSIVIFEDSLFKKLINKK